MINFINKIFAWLNSSVVVTTKDATPNKNNWPGKTKTKNLRKEIKDYKDDSNKRRTKKQSHLNNL